MSFVQLGPYKFTWSPTNDLISVDWRQLGIVLPTLLQVISIGCLVLIARLQHSMSWESGAYRPNTLKLLSQENRKYVCFKPVLASQIQHFW